MNQSSDAYPRLIQALNEIRRQWRTQKVLEGILLTLAGMAGILVLLVLADNLLKPAPVGRLLLAALLWGSLTAGIVALIVRRWLEDRRDDFFAALIERKHPALANKLINALQLGRGTQAGVSAELVAAIVKDADRAALNLDFTDAINRKPTLHAGMGAGIALTVLAVYAIFFGPQFFNGLSRVLLPGAAIEPFTQTQIAVVTPGDGVVPEGSAVAIEARLKGKIPAHATLYRRTAGGVWQTSDMLSEGRDDTFRFEIKQAATSFEYYLTANDTRSESFKLEVIKPPQVARLSVLYTPPAYTGLPPRPSTEGDISGVAGTRVQLALQATSPLQSAALFVSSGEKIDLDPPGEGRDWTTSFTIWEPAAKVVPGIGGKLLNGGVTYQVKLLDTRGYDNRDRLWRPIALLRDQPPVVGLQAPGDRLGVAADAVLPLIIEARDDFGLAAVRLLYRVNEQEPREVTHFDHSQGAPRLSASRRFDWNLKSAGLKVGQRVEYWAEALDRNDVTGPGKGESRHLTLEIIDIVKSLENVDVKVIDYADELRALIKLQSDTRVKTAQRGEFPILVRQQAEVRGRTRNLARNMENDGLPLATMVQALDALAAGPMAESLKLLESGRDAKAAALADGFRTQSTPIQDRIIATLKELLERLERNDAARKELKKLEKKDKPAYQDLTKVLEQMLKGLSEMVKDQTELASKFERLPKRDPDKIKDDMDKALKDLEELKKKTQKWAKGTVNELTKLPTGFVDDFKLRPDANKIYEEIEKALGRPKAEKIEVSLEDLGAGLAAKMKEDLEMWLADTPDAVKWVQEEPLNKKPMKVPEMPLPKALEDLVGDLLQKADEFDKDADDVTSAWGDNLDQAGWGVSDGPISTFSAKGKTGNDLPNNQEVTGRSGDGRRGKSTGQMVGDTSKALKGRQTPARVGAEKYEPGQLKQENQDDPGGATGGGKKAGAGRRGLQGGSPPDMVKDIGRLSAKQAGLREKAEQVAQKLDSTNVTSKRLADGIELMKSAEKDLTDRRYEDAFRKQKTALQKMRGAFSELDHSTAAKISRSKLPEEMRKELLQSADEGYPPGYEGLLRSYYKALSGAEK